ncbi:hypothetical protein A6J65_017645 [Yersinia enterocolitica]|nr:hypothetical protein A6J65_017645 [Yersinia enterocolitica]
MDVIGMADHSAKGAIDPPLPHRLDPFYPQAITSAGSVTWCTAFRAPQQPRSARISEYNGITFPISNHRSSLICKGSHGDPCDLSGSPYNPQPYV